MKHMILSIILTLSTLVTPACSGDGKIQVENQPAAKIDWSIAADKATKSLTGHFWNSSMGYFNYLPGKEDGLDYAFSYWPQAHAMDVVIDAYLRTGDDSYKNFFDKWYIGIKFKSNGTYYNTFYDDMEWICLTMLRLYDTTRENKYLNTAKDLWEDIKTGWNLQGDGGIAWRKDQLWSKNACSNGPAGIIAARLYRISKDADDLQWAKDIFEWEYDHLYEPSTGRIYDSIDTRTGERIDWCFTYNQGTFLGLAHELWRLTGERIYLNTAVKAATFTTSSELCVSGKVLRNEGNGDGGLFKGIFVRYLTLLIQDDGLTASESKRFSSFLERCATTLWNDGCNDHDNPLFGPDWASPDGTVDLGTQVSGAALLEAMSVLKK